MTGMARAMVVGAVVAASATAGWLLVSSKDSGPGAQLQPLGGLQTALHPDAITAPRPAAPLRSPVPDPVADAVPSAPLVVLTGVVVATGGRDNVAIVSVDRRPEMLMRVGDALGASATVVRIDDASMTYRLADKELSVVVKQSASVTAAVQPIAPPKQYAGFVAAAPAIARGPGSEPGSGNEAFRQAVEKKFQAIAAGR